VTVVNRMVDARPCNVFVVLRRVRNSRTIIIIIITVRVMARVCGVVEVAHRPIMPRQRR